MGSILLTVFGSVVVAALGVAGTLITLRWKASGRVKTTEADQLWNSSEKFRDDLQKRLESVEKKAEALQEKVNALQEENLNLREELYKTRRAAIDLNNEVASIKSGLTGDVSALKQELSVLQGGSA